MNRNLYAPGRQGMGLASSSALGRHQAPLSLRCSPLLRPPRTQICSLGRDERPQQPGDLSLQGFTFTDGTTSIPTAGGSSYGSPAGSWQRPPAAAELLGSSASTSGRVGGGEPATHPQPAAALREDNNGEQQQEQGGVSSPPASYSDYYRRQNAGAPDSSSTQQQQQQQQEGPTPSGDGDAQSGGQGGETSVAQALERAQEALQKVEDSLDTIDTLPSAQPPSKMEKALKIVKTVVILGGLSVAMVASHAFGLIVQWAGASAGALAIAWWGYRRNALNVTGCVAALVVGAGTLGCSLRLGATLLAFFFSSSKLTQYKEEVKEGLDDAARAGGQRDWKQVGARAR